MARFLGWSGIWAFACLFLIFFPTEISGQTSCAEAPTPAAKIVCEQLHKWDTEARKAPPVSALPRLPPSIPGAPTPLMGAELATIPVTNYQCMDLGCLCNFMGGNGQTGSNSCTLSNGKPLTKARRKEYRMLTDDERQQFHQAVLTLKKNGEYDNIARIHSQFASSGGAHGGPAFVSWHREYVKRYEIALRMINPNIALPYWDSTLDGSLPNPVDSIMWTDSFMGLNDASGNLNNGPFANWRTLENRPNLQRRLGAQGKLFTEDDIQYVVNSPDLTRVFAYTAPNPQGGCPVKIDWKALEYTHGNVHIFVGGDMITQATSANDPIFWLLHSFVDFIWEMYRQNKQDRFSREMDYPLDQIQCSSAQHFASAYMAPFQPWRNNDGLSNKYTDNMFEFEPRPTCPTCGGSPYLFCDISHGRPKCAAKIKTGGNCTGFDNGEPACYDGHCDGGRCVGGPPPTTAKPLPLPTIEKQNCFNEHECCAVWNQKGECTRNPSYMNQWCRASCGKCQPNYSLDECNDRHPKCDEWSRNGECNKNPLWMAENCRKACNKCGRTRQQICGGGSGGGGTHERKLAVLTTVTTPPPDQCKATGCFNEYICCQFWGLQGQCARNATWMSCNCRVTCGNCIPTEYQYGTCLDYHAKCQEWKAKGECQKNPWMLENCKTSCDTCFSWFELRQFCRSGGTGSGRGSNRGKRNDIVEDFEIFDVGKMGMSYGMPSIDLDD